MIRNFNQGISYPLSILGTKYCSQIIFWLGVKPLDIDTLHELLTNISKKQLISVINSLQDDYLVNPIQQANRFSLTDNGYELLKIIMQLGVWGRQQMDYNDGKTSERVVIPDSSMSQKELMKFKDKVAEYI